MRLGIFAGLFLFAVGAQAYEPKEGSVTATFGPTFTKTRFVETETSGAKTKFVTGWGLMVLGDINEHSSLEIAMFYHPQLFVRESAARYIVEKTQVMDITMGYRYWLSSIFSVSGSFYSAYSMGDPDTVYTDFAPGTDIDTSARDTTEYGFDAALQTELWNSERWAVTADTRYSVSVTNKDNEKADRYGVFIGVRYLVKSK
jgi:hypothetical protein